MSDMDYPLYTGYIANIKYFLENNRSFIASTIGWQCSRLGIAILRNAWKSAVGPCQLPTNRDFPHFLRRRRFRNPRPWPRVLPRVRAEIWHPRTSSRIRLDLTEGCNIRVVRRMLRCCRRGRRKLKGFRCAECRSTRVRCLFLAEPSLKSNGSARCIQYCVRSPRQVTSRYRRFAPCPSICGVLRE
jgi:hypothetical protein